jgi:gamma-glutamylcyclotransferase (GGCT)/AIG2-like uncharacterized protein YtfP
MSKATDLYADDSIFLFDSLPDELYYFAYGSNMNALQMRKRCSTPKVVAIARLADYSVGFFGHCEIWDSAQETVVRAPGRDVWGVVYEIGNPDLEKLDAWQDVRMDGTGRYFHYPARVRGVDGLTYTVLFYKKDTLGEPKKPSKPYLDFIITGAEEKQLPAAYIKELRAIESKLASYPVPKQRAFNPESLPAWDCSTCSG